jgi:MoaA/NifB/PqqE/SkfB family radical SAM enzyme
MTLRETQERLQSIVTTVIAAWAARGLGSTPCLPLSMTVAVGWECNARCLTCRVYDHEPRAVLSPADYDRIFTAFVSPLQWLTLTGGEPSLRADLVDVVQAIVRRARPHVITLPTNGIATARILELVDEILEAHHGPLVVNVSLDHVGNAHDALRGTPRAFERAVDTLQGLKERRDHEARLVVGINAVISRYNVEELPEITDALLALSPDSYVVEVAQVRKELQNSDPAIVPPLPAVLRALGHVRRRLHEERAKGTARLIMILRRRYYRYLNDYLTEPRQVWPCYAGIASAYLTPEGNLWACGVAGDVLGDLPAAGLDLARVWASTQARTARLQIKRKRCHCALANAAYTNMMATPAAWPGLMRDLARAV